MRRATRVHFRPPLHASVELAVVAAGYVHLEREQVRRCDDDGEHSGRYQRRRLGAGTSHQQPCLLHSAEQRTQHQHHDRGCRRARRRTARCGCPRSPSARRGCGSACAPAGARAHGPRWTEPARPNRQPPHQRGRPAMPVPAIERANRQSPPARHKVGLGAIGPGARPLCRSCLRANAGYARLA